MAFELKLSKEGSSKGGRKRFKKGVTEAEFKYNA